MKNIWFFLSLFSLILPLKVFPCPTAFGTETGSSVVRDFMSGKKRALQRAVDLINLYNPKLDLQLKRAEYSRETFQRDIDLDNQALLLLRNFYTGHVHGANSFFVGEKIRAYSTSSSVPLIGRVVRRTGRKTAIVEVITFSSHIKKMEVEIEVSFHFDLYNEGTNDRFGDGFKVFLKSKDFGISVQQGHPGLGMVFMALQSNKSRLDSRLLGIPKDNEEQRLKAQGFSSAYVRGINEVNEWITVADQMRKLRVHPYRTHIDYLADKARDYIAYMRKDLVSSEGRAEKNLDRLEKIVEQTIQESEFTYSWWLRFNYALSKVHGYDDINRSGMKLPRADERHFVNRFPTHIVMPTITGKMGVMALNRANKYNIYPVGLLKQGERGDGLKTVGLTRFFNHDIRHAIKLINMGSTYFLEYYRPVYDHLWQEVEMLPVERRKNVELALFVLIHEGARPFITAEPFIVRSQILETLEGRVRFDFNFNGLLSNASNKDRKLEQVKQVAEDFVEVFSQVRAQTRSLKSVSMGGDPPQALRMEEGRPDY